MGGAGLHVPTLRQQLQELVLVHKVAGHDGKRQTAVVADVLAPFERIQQTAHHRAAAQIVNRHWRPPRLALSVLQPSVFLKLRARRERGATFQALQALRALVCLPLVVR
jgi:hypothetical protein